MPWEIVEIGEGETKKKYIPVDENGLPVYIGLDEKKIGVDWDSAQSRIGKFIDEEKKIKKKLKETEEGYQAFRDKYKNIEDPESAFQALQEVQKLKDKKMVDGGEAEKLRKQIVDEYERKIGETKVQYDQRLKEFEDKLKEKDNTIYQQMVSNKFSDSKYIREDLIIPPDIAELKFGQYIKIENGEVVGYHMAGPLKGDKILSKAKPGELAKFEEIMEILVSEYDRASEIKRGKSQSGSGSHGSEGGGAGKNYQTLDDFASAKEKSDYIKQDPEGWQRLVERSLKKK